MFEENPSSLPAAPLPTPGTPPESKSATPAAPPPNLPSADIEDMFDKTEPVKTAPMPNMNAPMPNAAPAVQPPMVTNRKTIVIASLILGIVILIGGGIALARFLGAPILGMTNPSSPSSEEVATETTPESTPPGAPLTESPLARFNENNGQTPSPSSDTALTPTETIAPKDTDSDGLNDDEETVLGTDITSSDTDKDGLSDYDEVRVYRTDPANADTDGDTFKDGDEVKNGYNPAGAGKIFGAPPASDATNPSAGTGQPQP